VIYASDGTGVGTGDAGEIVAYSPTAALLWRLPTSAGTASLAERGDGVLLVADRSGLSALGPGGARLWNRALGQPSATGVAAPSLVIDAAGHAFVGTSDGYVRAIGPAGALLWTLGAGGPAPDGEVPALALGPAGALAVTGTDRVLRVYR
jgi:outer membrane protein assembly factor BamB